MRRRERTRQTAGRWAAGPGGLGPYGKVVAGDTGGPEVARLAVLGSGGLLAVPGPVQSLEVARPVPRVSESVGMGGGTAP